MWYRVRLSKDGAIRDCKLIEESQQDGDVIFFVDEDSAEAAIVEAKRLYAIKYGQELRAARRKAGECLLCQAPADATYCDDCRVEQQERRAELQRVKAALGLQPTDKLPAEYRKRQPRHPSGFGRYVRMHRYKALVDAKEVIKTKRSISEAVRVLNNEIAKIAPTPKGKLRRVG